MDTLFFNHYINHRYDPNFVIYDLAKSLCYFYNMFHQFHCHGFIQSTLPCTIHLILVSLYELFFVSPQGEVFLCLPILSHHSLMLFRAEADTLQIYSRRRRAQLAE